MLERAFEMNEELYQIANKEREIFGEDSKVYKMYLNDWATCTRLFTELFGFKDVPTFLDAKWEYINKIK